MSARTAAAAATLFTLALITGCSMAQGDPKHPKKNPHPVQRYEVIATADAPGPWDSVHGDISYEVVNPDCTPEDKFLGVHAMPPVVQQQIAMTRIDGNTWKGHFYRDAMLDQNYYGLGTCHWDAVSSGVAFVIHGASFATGSVLKNGVQAGSRVTYFKRTDYGNQAVVRYGPQDYSDADTNVTKHPEEYFSIRITVREVKP